MGVFSKIWKGIKKVAKKVGKGIKKAVYKVAEIFSKLGIVGQLIVAYYMPYALGALSSFAGGVVAKVGTWASTLAKSSNFFAAKIGQGMQFVIKAGKAVKTMYTSATEMLTAGVDKAKEFFGFKPTDTVNLAKTVNDDITAQIDAKLTNELSATLPQANLAINKEAVTESLLAKTTKEKVKDTVTGEIIEKASEGVTTNIFQEAFADANIFNPDSKIRQDIADFSAYDYAKTTATAAVGEVVVGGAVAAGKQKVASAFGYKVPNSNQTYINLPEMQAAGRNVGKYNEATLWAQENGNNFLTQSFRPRDYVAEAFGNEDSVATYFAKMQNQLYNQDQNNTLFTGTA